MPQFRPPDRAARPTITTGRPAHQSSCNSCIILHQKLVLRAVADEIGGEGAYAKARSLIAALQEKHAPIGRFFGSGMGLDLQRHDSDIAESIIRDLLRRDVPVLPIHDSFIVEERHKGFLLEAMACAVDGFVARTGNSSKATVGYRQNIRHREGGREGGWVSSRPFRFLSSSL